MDVGHVAEQELPPDLSEWLHSQEFIDRYNAYITEKIETEKHVEEIKKVRNVEREEAEERKRILREEYEASPAYKIELEIKKLKEERSLYIKKYIQPLHDALVAMGAVCDSDKCDCCDDNDEYWNY